MIANRHAANVQNMLLESPILLRHTSAYLAEARNLTWLYGKSRSFKTCKHMSLAIPLLSTHSIMYLSLHTSSQVMLLVFVRLQVENMLARKPQSLTLRNSCPTAPVTPTMAIEGPSSVLAALVSSLKSLQQHPDELDRAELRRLVPDRNCVFARKWARIILCKIQLFKDNRLELNHTTVIAVFCKRSKNAAADFVIDFVPAP